MACSSSKRNSARARAVSVLPTPVGPRKIKEPMGRLGSLRPARERRMALATMPSAASWPTTRSRKRSSIVMSFFTSPSSMRETGMPVHLLTILAMSSSSTSSFNMRAAPPLPSCAALSFLSSASSLGSSPYWICAARSRWPLRVCSSASKRRSSIFFLSSLMRLMASRSLVQRAARAVIFSVSSATSRSTSAAALDAIAIGLALQSCAFDFERRPLTLQSGRCSVGFEPILNGQ